MRHGERVFHVQTEDSGVNRPRVTTHVFYRGKILATRKTEYQPQLPAEEVQRILQEQHKALLRQLRDGQFDEPAQQFDVSHPPPRLLEPTPDATLPDLTAPEPARLLGPISAKALLEQQAHMPRLDEPGATIVTTAPYNPTMGRLEQPGADPAAPPSSASPAAVLELEAEPASDDEVSWESTSLSTGLSTGLHGAQPLAPPTSRKTPARAPVATQERRAGAKGDVIIVHPQPVAGPPQGAPARPSGRSQVAEFQHVHTRVRLPGSGIFRTPPSRPPGDANLFQPRPTAEGVVVQRPPVALERIAAGSAERQPARGATLPKAGTDPRLPPMTADERSLDEVILAYLAEDLHSKK